MNNFYMEFDLNNAQVDTNIDMQYYLYFVVQIINLIVDNCNRFIFVLVL